jgi:hypothetical protein
VIDWAASRRPQIVTEILDAITGWENAARKHGVHQSEITHFDDTFSTGAQVLRSLSA